MSVQGVVCNTANNGVWYSPYYYPYYQPYCQIFVSNNWYWMSCPKCGKLVEWYDKFCRHCGADLQPKPKVCPTCGRELPESGEEKKVET
jgi:predicted amidophosphoribosyltransferase